MNKKYYIAMPNVSSGSDSAVYEQIVDVTRNVAGVTLVKYEPDAAFNRTVINLIGEEGPLMDVLVSVAEKCAELIDMNTHSGTHPRLGALDILPVFPFKNTTIEDAIGFISKLGKKMFDELQVPVFLAGENGCLPERKNHMNLRKGQYEGVKSLLKKIKDQPEHADEYALRAPDYSTDGLLSEKFGGALLYALESIPSYHNIFLNTEDLSIAKAIAKTVRSSTGGFSTVTAIGIKFEGTPGVVVSLNISDVSKTPIYIPFEFVKREARHYGVQVVGSELVGVVRLDPIIECVKRQLKLDGFDKGHIMETHLM
jgi:glutamate formiminotransferase/formiminotetrahydrofolate cyclodeaminase